MGEYSIEAPRTRCSNPKNAFIRSAGSLSKKKWVSSARARGPNGAFSPGLSLE